MRHVTYLAVLAGCLFGAAWLEPFLRVKVLRRWRLLVAAVLPVATIFLAWDIAAVAVGHWSFDPEQIIGLRLPGGVPIEEVLFFLVVPICAVLGFEAVRGVLERRRAPGVGLPGDRSGDPR